MAVLQFTAGDERKRTPADVIARLSILQEAGSLAGALFLLCRAGDMHHSGYSARNTVRVW